MTILSAMQSAAVRLLGRRPDVFFGAGSGNIFELEITDLVNEVARDIAKSHDWQALVQICTLSGDGATSEFDLPPDYDRMLVASRLQDPANWAWGYRQISDINAYLSSTAQGFGSSPGGWIIFGSEMRFSPAPTGEAQFPYISSFYARDSATTLTKCVFTADTDCFVLPERLLTLGLVWRWRENKKLDFTGDQEAFTKAIGEYAAKDRGARSFSRSSSRAIPGTHTAWPWPLGGA